MGKQHCKVQKVPKLHCCKVAILNTAGVLGHSVPLVSSVAECQSYLLGDTEWFKNTMIVSMVSWGGSLAL